MSTEINQRELRNDSGDVMRRVEAGEDFIVTRNGVPVAELRPVRRRTFVPTELLVTAFASLPRIDYERWRADLDRVVDQDIEPRG